MKLTLKFASVTALVGFAVFGNAQFSLFATESQNGSLGGNTSLYGGIQQYNFASTGGVAVAGPGIASSVVHDPVGLRSMGTTVFVGNRFGNQANLGSIQQFTFNGTGLTFNQDITGNGLQRVHGVDVNPVSGELYGVNIFSAGVSRFLPSGGSFNPNGMISGGDWRDVLASPSGNKLYTTELNNVIRIHDIVTNTNTTFTVSGSNAMHQMAWHNGAIYVTSFNSGTVHRIDLDANGNPTGSSIVVNSPSAIGIAFSPDGQEMFVSGHTTNDINRYQFSGNAWSLTGTINTGHNMGYLAVVPEPGTMVLLGAGAFAMLKRRRR